MCSIDAQGGEKFFSMCRNKIGEIAERCFQNFMERIASLMPTDKKPSHSNLEDYHDSRDYTPLKNSNIEEEPGQSSSQKIKIADRKPQSQIETNMTDRKPSHSNLEDHDTRDYTPLENSMPEGKLEQLSSQNEINLAEDSSEADGGDDDSSSVATETSEGTIESEKSLGDADSVPQKRVSKKSEPQSEDEKANEKDSDIEEMENLIDEVERPQELSLIHI